MPIRFASALDRESRTGIRFRTSSTLARDGNVAPCRNATQQIHGCLIGDHVERRVAPAIDDDAGKRSRTIRRRKVSVDPHAAAHVGNSLHADVSQHIGRCLRRIGRQVHRAPLNDRSRRSDEQTTGDSKHRCDTELLHRDLRSVCRSYAEPWTIYADLLAAGRGGPAHQLSCAGRSAC